MSIKQEIVLHKKSFKELTVDELYELLRVRSEVFVVEQDCVYQDMDNDAIARSLERTAVVKITLTAPPTGKRKQYDKEGEEMKYGRME